MSEMQYVVFRLGKEKYCIDISFVAGISEYKEVTSVPDAPYFIDGMINLRGDIIPIVNLKKRFKIAQTEQTDETRIIIVKVSGKDVGFLVDEASQVLRISTEDIEQAPEIIKGKDREYISGVAKISGEIAIVLDLERILNEDEKEVVMAI